MQLGKYVMAHTSNGKGIFGLGSKQVSFDSLDDWATIVKIAAILKADHSLDELLSKVPQVYPELSKHNIVYSYNFLLNNNFLVEGNLSNQFEEHSRSQLLYELMGKSPDNVLSKYRNATVAMIGCGGIANVLLHSLSCAGVGNIILVDDDVIELSNLERQFLFTLADIGDKKIDVLEREIYKRCRSVKIIKYDTAIHNTNSFYQISEDIDLLLLSADTPADIIYWANQFCVENSIPYVNIGYINDISVYGPFVIPGVTGCFSCSHHIQDNMTTNSFMYEELQIINKATKMVSFPSINHLAASIALHDIFKFLGGFGTITAFNKRIGIHFPDLRIETQDFTKNPKCQVCSRHHQYKK